MRPKISGFSPKDREHASWARTVEAAIGATIDVTRVSVPWNSDSAPLSVRTSLTVRPNSVLLLSATTGDGSMVSGAPVTWSWDDGSIVIAAVGTLTSSTDYELVLGVVS